MGIQSQKMQDIADALRSRGHAGPICGNDFASRIRQMPSMAAYQREDPPWVGWAAGQAVRVARSYWDARVAGKITYAYDGGNGPFDGVVFDGGGRGIIDCSTFVRLVLQGIDFEHSPYATGDIASCLARPDLHSWADTAMQENQVRYAADLAEYMFRTGRVLGSLGSIRPGDLLFHASGSIQNRFMGISHVSIVAEEGFGEVSYYNATDLEAVVVRSRLSARSDYVFAARPDYAPRASYPALNPDVNLLGPPWYGVPGAVNGCTMTVHEDGGLEAVGTPTAGASFSLVSGSYPMYLRPGHYRLSGAPLRADTTTGYTWGLAVTDPDDATINYGWDRGEGAEFTLTEITPVKVYIYISASKSPDGYVWRPVLTGEEA